MVSCVCHDLDHRGTTNSFQTKSGTALADLYSSEGSVMENFCFPVAETCIMAQPMGCFLTALHWASQCRTELVRDVIQHHRMSRSGLLAERFCAVGLYQGIKPKFPLLSVTYELNMHELVLRHHFAQAACMLNTPGCNILDGMPREDYTKCVDLIRDMILATDLATHFKTLKEQQKLLEGFEKDDENHRHLLLSLLMTACDLSDQTKD
ncbi:hypothetical protein ANN_08732 [Periplaneta americana]|uniref:PDEase domain-containing protein n=1 Tax=Periplaneta americana TaxID=6978 RepID=A0ABQ8T3U5_PERAM|nr:hypothetical protein ANN_08732 [Periplaneta americana]